LFLGMPTEYCQPIAGIRGELGAGYPLFTYRVAVVDSGLRMSPCDLGNATTTMQIAPYLPVGVQLRIQALAVHPDGLAFSRATEIHTR
jgi:hypothetical protein